MANNEDLNELFKNGPVQILNKTAAEGDAPLLKQKAAAYIVQSERPEHREILELVAKGYTFKEVAAMTGKSPTCVQYIAKQPATEQVLANTIRRNFGEDEKVVELIRDNVLLAANTWVDIMKNPNARAADRIAAAERLFERRYGKANQPINRGTDVDLNDLSDSDLAKMLPTEGTGTS